MIAYRATPHLCFRPGSHSNGQRQSGETKKLLIYNQRGQINAYELLCRTSNRGKWGRHASVCGWCACIRAVIISLMIIRSRWMCSTKTQHDTMVRQSTSTLRAKSTLRSFRALRVGLVGRRLPIAYVLAWRRRRRQGWSPKNMQMFGERASVVKPSMFHVRWISMAWGALWDGNFAFLGTANWERHKCVAPCRAASRPQSHKPCKYADCTLFTQC